MLAAAFDSQAILPGDYPDPSLLRVGGDYYLTHSSFTYAPGLLIWNSTDLVHWRPLAYALNQFDGDVWAPDLIQFGDTFYIYYKTTAGIHVVTAPHPAGPWSEPIDVRVPGWFIDPGHLAGPDGQRYLYLSDGHMVQLSPDGLTAMGKPERRYEGWPIPPEMRVEGVCLEGPKFLHKDGYIYLITAEGGTAGPATGHMTIVARSRHPLGPWENCPHNPMLATTSRKERWWSRGHATIFDSPDGRWWAVYHAYERGYHTLGRQTLLMPVRWDDQGWPHCDSSALPPESVSTTSARDDIADDFAEPTLGLHWRFQGEFDAGRFAVGNHALKLSAIGQSVGTSHPLTVIARHHAYTVEVEVEALSEDTCAGLALFYNADCHAGLVVKRSAGEWRVHFERARESGWALCGTSGNRVGLRIVNDAHELDFFVRSSDNQWERIRWSIDTSGYHHNTFGGFLSLRPALICYGGGAANFRAFLYRGITSKT